MLLNLIASPLKELPEGLSLEGLEQSKTCKQALTMPCDSPLALSLRLSCPPFGVQFVTTTTMPLSR